MRKSLALLIPFPFFVMVYGACSSGDDTSNPDAQADVTTKDVALDKKVLPDVTATDTGPMGCAPDTTIDTSQITWYPPNAPNPTACSSAQIAAFYTNCYGTGATSQLCSAWQTANANCEKCMSSTYGTDTTFGAIVAIGGVAYANIAGCIAIETGDSTATGCGAKYQAVSECEELACGDNCPVTDQTSFTAYTTCATAADNGVCKSTVEAQCNLQDAGIDADTNAYNICQNHTSFQDYFTTMGTIFCGGYTSDAGTGDAAADAPDGD